MNFISLFVSCILIIYSTLSITHSRTFGNFVNTSNTTSGPNDGILQNLSVSVSPSRRDRGQNPKHVKCSSEEDDHDNEGDSSEEEKDEKVVEQSHIELSEEKKVGPDDNVNWNLSPVQLQDLLDPQNSQRLQNNAISIIHNSFVSRKTFSCPKIKNDFLTGTDTSDLSPEDIGIIAAMGDSLATGKGLWPQTDIEFRGAAFPIGGDATIDGLVTIPNILHEFNEKLVGVSHGMGTSWQLPDHQLNVAEGGATSSNMPFQAKELVRRLNGLREVDVYNEWTMIIITIGTEEICTLCKPPDYSALLESLLILNQGIRNAFVVLLGPIHVSSSYRREANLLKSRCSCLKNNSDEFMKKLSREWAAAFSQLQSYFEESHVKQQKFGLLTLPMLTITSRYPYSLFIPNSPLLNRKGHTYATKWLWNRLMTGPNYNLSLAVLSQDSYYCPSMSCPYFRTMANRQYCRLLRLVDIETMNDEIVLSNGRPVMRRSREKLYATAGTVIIICFFSVLIIGAVLYQKSKYEMRARYGKNLEDKEGEDSSFVCKADSRSFCNE